MDNFGICSPIAKDFGEEFSHLVGDTYKYQILGAFDTVYVPVPTDYKKQTNNFLAEFEELFHLQQLRNFTAGWYLETMQKLFLKALEDFSADSGYGTLAALQRKFAECKTYWESIKPPLEYQIRTRYLFHLTYRIKLPLSLKLPLPFLQVNLQTEEAKKALAKLRKTSTREKVKKIFYNSAMKLFEFRDFIIQESLGICEKRKPVYQWVKKVLEIADPSLGKMIPFPAQYLIEAPSFIALNPALPPTYSNLGDQRFFLLSDPKTRFLTTISILLKVPNEKIETSLKASLKGPKLYKPLHKLVVEEVLGRGVPFPNPEFLTLLRKKTEEALPHLDSSQPFYLQHLAKPLLSLRATKSGLPYLSSDFISNDPSPTIKIYKEGEKRFLVDLPNLDGISKHFMEGLKLFIKGCEVIKKLGNLSDLEQLSEYFRLSGQQQLILILKNIPVNAIPLNRQSELAQTVGICNWPLTNKKLSKTLKLSLKDINQLDPLFDNNVGALVSRLWDFLKYGRDQKVDNEGDLFTPLIDILSAFDDVNLLNKRNQIAIAKFMFPKLKPRDGVVIVKSLSSRKTYHWDDLIKEISTLTPNF